VLLDFKGGSTWGFNIQQKATLLRAIADRRHNDLVDMQKFMRLAPKRQRKGRKRILEALQDYDTEIQSKGTLDFAQLERRFADGLAAGAYKGFADQLKAILVDEYQDTNALQESIYLSLAKASGASVTVVGDDDQSLYRFRGATVELFKDYPKRLKKDLGRSAKLVFLTRNYRSTEQIVKFVGDYAELDRKFQEVRVRNKPRITACRPGTSTLPVAAMFRDDTKSLARDLAKFLHSMFRSRGVLVGGEFIECGAGGDAGDVALLCYSPMEDGEKRLPSLLRNELSSLNPPIDLFNPRGEELSKIPLMQEFGGLVLNCLDPSDQIAPLLRSISKDAKETLASWRIAAERRLNGKSSTGLRRYVEAWSKRTNGKATEVPAIDLVYDLRRWFPEFQQDSEQQVYFEGFTRQLQAAEKLGSFSGRIIRDPKNPELSKKSREHLIRDFLGPIATGIVGVNEELIAAFPHNRISVLSIHQAKGLEFPVVVVDVGSRFKNDSYVQRRFRFPEEGDVPHRLENAMRPASRALGQPNRDVIDRAFDDLYRLYYVAFSRARDLLLLVGLNKQIPNIARGWTRNKRDRWSSNQPYIEM
jgi:DNA helicase-2/ATP-dependent DNA helicase PcrA